MLKRTLLKLKNSKKLSIPVCEDSTMSQTGDSVVVDYTNDYGSIPLEKYTYKLDGDKKKPVESYLTIVDVKNAGVLLARYNLLKQFGMVDAQETFPIAIKYKGDVVALAIAYNNLERNMHLINIGNPNSAFPIEPAFASNSYETKVRHYLMYLDEKPEVMKVEDVEALKKELLTRWIVKTCLLGMEHDHINMLYDNKTGEAYLAEDYINSDTTIYFSEEPSKYLGFNLHLIEKECPGLLSEVADRISPLLETKEEGGVLTQAHHLLVQNIEELLPFIGEYGEKETSEFITKIIDRMNEFVQTYQKQKIEELHLQ